MSDDAGISSILCELDRVSGSGGGVLRVLHVFCDPPAAAPRLCGQARRPPYPSADRAPRRRDRDHPLLFPRARHPGAGAVRAGGGTLEAAAAAFAPARRPRHGRRPFRAEFLDQAFRPASRGADRLEHGGADLQRVRLAGSLVSVAHLHGGLDHHYSELIQPDRRARRTRFGTRDRLGRLHDDLVPADRRTRRGGGHHAGSGRRLPRIPALQLLSGPDFSR